MFLGDGDEVFFVCFVVADERAVGFDDDVVVAAVFDNFSLLVPGVKLLFARSALGDMSGS